jgi:hypothetical protein
MVRAKISQMALILSSLNDGPAASNDTIKKLVEATRQIRERVGK